MNYPKKLRLLSSVFVLALSPRRGTLMSSECAAGDVTSTDSLAAWLLTYLPWWSAVLVLMSRDLARRDETRRDCNARRSRDFCRNDDLTEQGGFQRQSRSQFRRLERKKERSLFMHHSRITHCTINRHMIMTCTT